MPKLRKTGMTVLVIVLILISFWWIRRRSETFIEIDLIQLFPDAEKRTTLASIESGFAIEDITIGGETRRSIYAVPWSRITWSVTVPRDGYLHTQFAMKPEAWTLEGDGAQFRIGVSDGRTYDELLRQHINPLESQGDRRWFTADLDLSAYEGRTINVIFNTDPGPPGDGNTANDWTVWGEPKIMYRP